MYYLGARPAGVSFAVAKDRLATFSRKMAELQRRIGCVWEASTLFGVPSPSFKLLRPLLAELELLSSAFDLFGEVYLASERFWNTMFKEVRFESVSEELLAFSRRVRSLPAEARDLPVYRAMARIVDNLNALMPLFSVLAHPTVQPRHWRSLEAGMGITLPVSSAKFTDGGFALRSLMRCPLLKYRALVDSICVAARKEAEVSGAAARMRLFLCA